MAATLDNSLAVPQMVKWLNIKLPFDPEFHSQVFKRHENTCPYKNLYINVYDSIILNSQKLETIQMPIN